jgi:hypothetical protein
MLRPPRGADHVLRPATGMHGPIVLNFAQEENQNNAIIELEVIFTSSNQIVIENPHGPWGAQLLVFLDQNFSERGAAYYFHIATYRPRKTGLVANDLTCPWIIRQFCRCWRHPASPRCYASRKVFPTFHTQKRFSKCRAYLYDHFDVARHFETNHSHQPGGSRDT